jgi:hypothetical protein
MIAAIFGKGEGINDGVFLIEASSEGIGISHVANDSAFVNVLRARHRTVALSGIARLYA